MTPQLFVEKWKLKRSELSLLLGVPHATISHWFSEKSEREPPVWVLKQLELIDGLWSLKTFLRNTFAPELEDFYELAFSRLEMQPNALNLSTLVSENWGVLTNQNLIPIERLNLIKNGHKASEVDIIRISSALQMSEVDIRNLSEKQLKKEKQNGKSNRTS